MLHHRKQSSTVRTVQYRVPHQDIFWSNYGYIFERGKMCYFYVRVFLEGWLCSNEKCLWAVPKGLGSLFAVLPIISPLQRTIQPTFLFLEQFTSKKRKKKVWRREKERERLEKHPGMKKPINLSFAIFHTIQPQLAASSFFLFLFWFPSSFLSRGFEQKTTQFAYKNTAACIAEQDLFTFFLIRNVKNGLMEITSTFSLML